MSNQVSRRNFIQCGACLGTAALFHNKAYSADANALAQDKAETNVRFCLNLGTIRSYDLRLIQELEVAKKAGYSSVEIWLDRLTDYARADDPRVFNQNKLKELKKYVDGEGLKIEGAIGFASWIVDDERRRADGLEELKRQVEALATIGASCIAAPASGTNDKIPVETVAKRYRTVLELCEPYGVRPLLELWGVSQTLGKVSDCLAICAETERTDAALLLDVYHMFRGGNSFSSLALISGSATQVFHMNDYPSEPPREKMNDGHRVFPGDGRAPLSEIMRLLHKNGFNGAFSFEIFNQDYRKQYSAVDQARIGLEKMQTLYEEYAK